MPVDDTWQVGDAYERYIGRWSRRVAPLFLDWLDIPSGRRWLDVGCGTGALCAAIVERCTPSSVTGIEPSEGFMATARRHLGERVMLHRGTAASMPLPDASQDVVVSALVLNFAPDAREAVTEMKRVAARDGVVAAYVWDYAGRMELLRHFWDTAIALDAAAASLDEGVRFPICRSEALSELFSAAGLRDVCTTALDVPTRFATFDDYWQPFLGGQGPAPAYVMSLAEEHRSRLRDALRARLPARADGTIELIARALAVRGTNARPQPVE